METVMSKPKAADNDTNDGALTDAYGKVSERVAAAYAAAREKTAQVRPPRRRKSQWAPRLSTAPKAHTQGGSTGRTWRSTDTRLSGGVGI